MKSQFYLDKWQRRVVHQLWINGAASRLDLAGRLDVSPAAMTKIARELMAMGLVSEEDATRGPARGRPSLPLRIAADGGYAIGATPHHGAVEVTMVDFLGAPIATVREPFDDPDPIGFARLIQRVMLELVEEHRLLGRRMLGVGIGVPGPQMASDSTRWITVPSLAGWRDVDLAQLMADRLAMPVWVDNDANVAALAEYYLGGVARRCRSTVVLLFGHGIGAGIIDQGRLVRGHFSNAGEAGQFFPGDRPRPTTVDLIGVLQAAGHPVMSASDIGDLVADGKHPVIDTWIERASAQLRPLVGSALALLDPGEVILSGPLPQRIRVALATRLADRRWFDHLGRPPIRASTTGETATVLGAALLPIMASAGIADSHARYGD